MRDMQDYRTDIAQTLPHLERFALSLTGNRDQAGDLVQDCVLRAMEKDHLFEPGTNRRKWLFALMRNIFVDGKRREQTRQRYAGEVHETYQSTEKARQFDRLVVDETMQALGGLRKPEREAIRLLCVEGLSHAEASRRTNVPIGTLKSRLSRGRSHLRTALEA